MHNHRADPPVLPGTDRGGAKSKAAEGGLEAVKDLVAAAGTVGENVRHEGLSIGDPNGILFLRMVATAVAVAASTCDFGPSDQVLKAVCMGVLRQTIQVVSKGHPDKGAVLELIVSCPKERRQVWSRESSSSGRDGVVGDVVVHRRRHGP
jgi:hypothetical protein